MVFGVVLVMALAVAFAINGQQDQRYDILQSEVSALRKFVLNMNVELDNVRKKYDDMREELRGSSKQQVIGTNPLLKSDDYNNYPHKDHGKTTLLNKRSTAYIPTLHLSNVWNGSKGASVPKGEKGDSGLQGHKGDNGTPGPQGPKGDNGTPGPSGTKGDNGTPGPKGPKGDNGQKGDIGTSGIKGQKGEVGSPGSASAKANEVSFSVGTTISNRIHDRNVVFDSVYWNDGNDYTPRNGVFTCEVAGVYLFTLSVTVNPGDEMKFSIKRNRHEFRYLTVSGSHNTGSVTAMFRLRHSEIVSIKLHNSTRNSCAVSYFEGVLLY